MPTLGASPLGGVSRDEGSCPPVPASPTALAQNADSESPTRDAVSGVDRKSALFSGASSVSLLHTGVSEPPIQLFLTS